MKNQTTKITERLLTCLTPFDDEEQNVILNAGMTLALKLHRIEQKTQQGYNDLFMQMALTMLLASVSKDFKKTEEGANLAMKIASENGISISSDEIEEMARFFIDEWIEPLRNSKKEFFAKYKALKAPTKAAPRRVSMPQATSHTIH